MPELEDPHYTADGNSPQIGLYRRTATSSKLSLGCLRVSWPWTLMAAEKRKGRRRDTCLQTLDARPRRHWTQDERAVLSGNRARTMGYPSMENEEKGPTGHNVEKPIPGRLQTEM